MVKNKTGGKGHKKYKKPTGDDTTKQLILKESLQEYGKVTKLLGNCRCDVMCDDGVQRQCGIRGTMVKRVWINNSDFVLVSLRDFQDYKADIIHKYNETDAKKLIQMSEIKNLRAEINTELAEEDEDSGIVDFAIDINDVQD